MILNLCGMILNLYNIQFGLNDIHNNYLGTYKLKKSLMGNRSGDLFTFNCIFGTVYEHFLHICPMYVELSCNSVNP